MSVYFLGAFLDVFLGEGERLVAGKVIFVGLISLC